MHVIYGIILMGIGVAMVFKSESLLSFFGRVSVFEHYLGTEGGSRLGYKLLGLFVAFIGVLVMTNMIDGFMRTLLSPLFP